MQKVFETEAKEIIYQLEASFVAIAAIETPDFSTVRNGVLTQLASMINKVRFNQLGLHPKTFELPDVAQVAISRSEPLTKIMGIDINEPRPSLTAQDVAVNDLKLQVDRLEAKFASLSNDEVLDATPDIITRAYAKRLGMPVTELNPAKLSIDFIEEMRKQRAETEAVKAQYGEII